MTNTVTLNYCCPTCGHTWDDSFNYSVTPMCDCPSCEELVMGVVRD